LNGEEEAEDGGGGWLRCRDRRRESQKAEVDPLPLVPVTWMTLRALRSEGYKRTTEEGRRKREERKR